MPQHQDPVQLRTPATEDELRASALQFVHKVSGMTHPSRANEEAFARAVDDVTAITRALLDSIVIQALPRARAEEAVKARARSPGRFGTAAWDTTGGPYLPTKPP